MRAAKINNVVLAIVAAMFFVLAFSLPAAAQSFGGGSSSSLYNASGAGIFQSSAGAQQGSTGAQAASSAAALQAATTGVGTLKVTGPAYVATAQEQTTVNQNMNDIVFLSLLAGIFAVGVLYLLWRQIKNSY
jgi:cobalamin biosynthesis Mg chelatase CobN